MKLSARNTARVMSALENNKFGSIASRTVSDDCIIERLPSMIYDTLTSRVPMSFNLICDRWMLCYRLDDNNCTFVLTDNQSKGHDVVRLSGRAFKILFFGSSFLLVKGRELTKVEEGQ